MGQYVWTGIAAGNASNVAERRINEGAATLLGATFPSDIARAAAIAELIASANFYTDANVVGLVDAMRRFGLYQALGNPTFAISSNFDVKNTVAINYFNAGTMKQLSVNTNFDTGTAKTVTGALFGAAVLYITSGGVASVLWATGGGYASEALAIAALVDPGATATIVGYFSIQAHASGFTAGTDALTTGSGGNVCTATTYYNAVPPVLLPGAAL